MRTAALHLWGNDVVASYDMFDAVADAYNQDAGKIDALISDFSATSEELLASIDGVLDAMEGIATATNEGAKERQILHKDRGSQIRGGYGHR